MASCVANRRGRQTKRKFTISVDMHTGMPLKGASNWKDLR